MGVAKVIGVFGLSGVGKSTTLQRVVNESEGLATVVNAGSLIGRRALNNGLGETLRLLPTEDILHNQEILVEELARERAIVGIEVILLDGHCVVDNGDQLVPIPVEIIERLNLSALVFVQEETEKIRTRRLRDEKRKRPDLSSTELTMQQRRALEVCSSYASELELSLTIITTDQWQSVARVVYEVAKSGARARACSQSRSVPTGT